MVEESWVDDLIGPQVLLLSCSPHESLQFALQVAVLVDITAADGLSFAVHFGFCHHHAAHGLSFNFFPPGFVPLLGLASGGDVISGMPQVQGVHKAHDV